LTSSDSACPVQAGQMLISTNHMLGPKTYVWCELHCPALSNW
jgi:hypothetical protein